MIVTRSLNDNRADRVESRAARRIAAICSFKQTAGAASKVYSMPAVRAVRVCSLDQGLPGTRGVAFTGIESSGGGSRNLTVSRCSNGLGKTNRTNGTAVARRGGDRTKAA